MVSHALISLLLAAPVLSAPSSDDEAADRPADYTLEWRAPPLCPSAVEVHSRIAALRHAAPGGAGAVRIIGEVERRATTDGGHYVLMLATDFAGRHDRRRVTAKACDALVESTAIVVATALDLGVVAAMATLVDEPPTPTPEPAPTAARGPAPIPPDELDVAGEDDATAAIAPPPRARALRPAASLRGALVGELGILGRATGGVAVGVGAAWRRASLELTGMYLAPRVRRDPAGRGGRFDAGVVNLRGCALPRVGRLELPLCGGFELGDVRVDTRGLPPRRLHALTGGPLVAVGVAGTWGRFRLSFGLETLVRVLGASWRLDRAVAFEQLVVSARAVLGAEVRLGAGPGRKSSAARKKPASVDMR
jgi:hypothetical protein